MTRTTKLRAVVLTTVIVLSIVGSAVGAVGTVTAANSATTDARDVAGPADPVTVYLGEENLELRNSEDLDDGDYAVGDTITLVGHSGDADGQTATVDSGDGDITASNGFAAGSYYIDDDSGSGTDIDLTVREPSIDDVTLYQGSGTGGADVTGASIAVGDQLTVEGEFNFDQAAPAGVVIEDETGDEITDSVLVSDDSWLVSSGSTVELDTTGLEAGDYTVTVNGSSDYPGNGNTDLSSASMSTTITLRSDDVTVSLNQDILEQGEVVTGTITGTPSDYGVVRISTTNVLSDADLAAISDGTGDDDIFRSTSDRTDIGIDDSDATIAAEYDLGDDGSAKFQIDTQYLSKGTTTTVEVIGYDNSGHIGDDSGFSDAGDDSDAFEVCGDGTPCPLGDAESKGIALADLDGDGDLDAFVANHGANAVWFNEGDGTFTDSGQELGSATTNAVALGDLDDDGDVDALAANDGENILWINDGTGSFSRSESGGLVGAIGVAAGDVNGDSVVDFVLARSSPNDVRLSEASASDGDSGSDASGLDDHWRSDEVQKQSGGATAAGPTTSAGEETATSEPRETDAPTATSSPTQAETATPTVTSSSTPSGTRTPTPTQAPGLGPIVALLAVLAVSLGRRHR